MPAAVVSDLRDRLDRLGAPPRPRPRPQHFVPRGFEAVATPFGDALLREDVVPLPALDPYPGSVAYIDTETTGLGGGAGTYVFAAAVARPIDCGLRLAPLIPDAYFDYLRRGSSALLDAVLEHNRLDVISLVHLHSRLLARLNGGDAEMDASDWLALGRHRLRRGARADGWRALRNAAGFAADEAAATAGLLIARRLARRRKSVAGAESFLGWLESRVASDVRLPVARARLLEWRRRDPQLALAVVEAAQSRLPEEAPALEARRNRLRRKVAKSRSLTKSTESVAASLFG